MYISKSNGKTWFQEGEDFLRREFGEHPEDIAIIPSVNIVSTDTGKRITLSRGELHRNFEKIKID
jgi:hypothetical protein